MKGKLKIIAMGVLAGIANGFFGGGGGVVLLIMLKALPDMEEKDAHANCVAIMLSVSAVSTVMYVLNGSLPPLDIILFTMGGTLVGGIIGAKLLSRFTTIWINRIFSIFVLASAVSMIL